jgi:hypothetical protein
MPMELRLCDEIRESVWLNIRRNAYGYFVKIVKGLVYVCVSITVWNNSTIYSRETLIGHLSR